MQGEKYEAITIPEVVMPKKDLEKPCPCQNIPVKLKYRKGTILVWHKEIGEIVGQNDVICEGEVLYKCVELVSPFQGILVEKCLDMNDEFCIGTILGYIEKI